MTLWSYTPRSRKLSNPCQEFWRWQVSGEAMKTSSWSTMPRQRAAPTQVSTGGQEGFRARQTSCSGGEGRNVRWEAAKLVW